MTGSKVRCAIYTRKSSDEGLEQEFNSLDAQYEACAAYIASQKHEGWRLARRRYDDAGLSGGTLERAGLQALLADIEAGLVDMIVVYKIDRLTRSLADFSKIVERLDARGASFVSVTQSFNTVTSMGRLTLNMLLSFAQFEREVTAERIRDKIAASKAKGLWMGGTVPLGYEPHPDRNVRGLVVHEAQAGTVNRIFRLYDELGCLGKVEAAVRQENLQSKNRNGSTGASPSRGAIHKLLTNPLYIGKIRHKDKLYDGQHKAIVGQELWDRVQQKLQAASARRRGTGNTAAQSGALLKSKLSDETGDHLTPTHTKKNGRVIRYYISNRLLKAKDPSGWRLPAAGIENAVIMAIRKQLPQAVTEQQLTANTSIEHYQSTTTGIRRFLENEPAVIAGIIAHISLSPGQARITLDCLKLTAAAGLPAHSFPHETLAFTLPMSLKKRGVEQKLVIGEQMPEPDKTLIKSLARAHGWLGRIRSGETLAAIAKTHKVTESYIRSRIPLALLSPKIQGAIINGTQPADLTLEKLVRSKIPLGWQAQEAMFIR